jgi:hypothetical protein
MNETPATAPQDSGKKDTILFAQVVEMLTQNAAMMMGMMPDPRGRQLPPNLDGAEMIIDMLSVIQKKTKGNLNKDEEKIISNTLFSLQTAFAELAGKSGEFEKARKATDAVNAVAESETPRPSPSSQDETPRTSRASASAAQAAPSTDRVYENKVKYSKKYA